MVIAKGKEKVTDGGKRKRKLNADDDKTGRKRSDDDDFSEDEFGSELKTNSEPGKVSHAPPFVPKEEDMSDEEVERMLQEKPGKVSHAPSLKREVFSTVPNVKWDDVGGHNFLRQEFDHYVVKPIKFRQDYEDFGVDLRIGLLLYGPPGCGKTLIPEAVANEAGANFIHIKGPELLNKYDVGESESAVQTIFSRARTCAPCVLFFDDVDAVTRERYKEGRWVADLLLSELMIALEDAEQNRGVYVIGATNRPELMDPAVLRPGRFGKLLYVPLPSPDERGMILKVLARKKPIDPTVDLMAIGRDTACQNLSGADLSALINEAALAALDEKLTSSHTSSSLTITNEHFKIAVDKISPSVSDEQRQYYKLLSESERNEWPQFRN